MKVLIPLPSTPLILIPGESLGTKSINPFAQNVLVLFVEFSLISFSVRPTDAKFIINDELLVAVNSTGKTSTEIFKGHRSTLFYSETSFFWTIVNVLRLDSMKPGSEKASDIFFALKQNVVNVLCLASLC